MFKIGLTGGIGSGKTLVSNYLKQMGVFIIDTDEIARDLTSVDGKAIQCIRTAFGSEAIDDKGSLNRIWMRNRIFLDYSEKIKLENILHPLIMEYAFIQAANFYGSYVVFVVPLLTESKDWMNKVDRICVVDCNICDQIKRVKDRDFIKVDLIMKIIQSQSTRSMRLKYADDVIYNGNDVSADELYRQVVIKHKNWCLLSQ
ncbi:dephospho-CoA kinase [Candidatus Kinetoplastidibacterium crithidiae]|uniref:Dephospho-CoA kinase n=1 Tax=Candidatus Kinetoplastidibacterium crithidiae TCC036E TaxID=1208918 RepID=M1LNV4_9PROT|nr:dephospho-CoA kinase [Candidatus Kinetoplastibacterium crithidii]AFZ83090.1 dephospho-CoA kinase [Candidatus Kinetoplastibacterium crithidii (ex Angomonas deanei ATCC 30255)]AGF47367.1 dephospho-CoA kinase [Candidatus Kinetoplastibacterium crithidii TCC036E]